MTRNLKTAWMLSLVLVWPSFATAAKVRYVFDGWQGPSMRVYVTRPAALAPDRPVVFVMHGTNRNADDYRDQWHDLAWKHDFLLVVPEFTKKDFPGSDGYNLGYREDENGNPRPRELWSYSAIEPLFDDARRRFGMNTSRYALYGHSAGAQFVHRYIFHVPEARVSQVVPANAGWYMMPDYQAEYPYGLGGSGVTLEALQNGMALPVTVLLGGADTDPEHMNLRRTPEALAQGPHRHARGQAFFTNALDWAVRAWVPFNWEMVVVPGVGHDNARMAPAAVPFLLRRP
jgi:poly(3-hydroxybutyrate) depolymerase